MDTADIDDPLVHEHKSGYPKWMNLAMEYLSPTTSYYPDLKHSIPEGNIPETPDDDDRKHYCGVTAQISQDWQSTDRLISKHSQHPSINTTNPQACHDSIQHFSSISSASSISTDSTPASSPPGSPFLKRNTDETYQAKCANPISWICQGFFPNGEKKDANIAKPLSQQKSNESVSPSLDDSKFSARKFTLPLVSGKKYNLSNFDINALSPNSW